MTQTVDFHQAQINCILKIVEDGQKTVGVRQVQILVLVDSDAEWASVRQQLANEIKKLEKELEEDV